MIELRWVERFEKVGVAHGEIKYGGFSGDIWNKVKVLQYRRMRKGMLMLDKNDNPIVEEWSDWIDVPTVTE